MAVHEAEQAEQAERQEQAEQVGRQEQAEQAGRQEQAEQVGRQEQAGEATEQATSLEAALATAPATPQARGLSRRAIGWEILIVLTITFGMSGLRSVLRLIDAYLKPERLNSQTVALNASQASTSWLDFSLQLLSSVTLLGWGALGALLLVYGGTALTGPSGLLRWRATDLPWGAAGAAIIGLPGLGLYVLALHLGWTKAVNPAGGGTAWWSIVLLVVAAVANAWAEEVVVVAWFCDRLARLGCSVRWQVVISAVLRGSYHLYQGPSAGVGNIVMGLVFAGYNRATGRVWPLVIAHALIDLVAFVGAVALAGHLGWAGL